MSHYDIYAIGNALVDSEYEVTDAQLQAMGVEKRHMTLIDMPRRTALLSAVQGLHSRRTGGGSAGNTVVAVAQLGGYRFVYVLPLGAWPMMSWALFIAMTCKSMAWTAT